LAFENGEKSELNKVEDIFVNPVEDVEAGRSSIEDHLDKCLAMCGQLEPLMRLTLGIRERGEISVEAV
jgi:hypothetical protein